MALRKTIDTRTILDTIEEGGTTIVLFRSDDNETALDELLEVEAGCREEEMKFFISESGYVPKGHGQGSLPLTVLYKDGEEKESTGVDLKQVDELIERAEGLE